MEQVAAAGGPPPAPASYAPEPLRFTGTGSGYFGIWIVNLLLTIVTLGIYSAWAKVRRLQYFYRHTELAGSSFDFHGSAARILLGRVIAVILLLLYNFTIQMRSFRALAAVLVGLAVLMPWLLRNAFRFRLYNASWRGTRFHFRGSLGGAYRVFLLNGILTLITLGFLTPLAHQRIKAWQHGSSWFGRTAFSFHASAGEFYGIYLITFGIMFAASLVIGAGIGGTMTALLTTSNGGHVDMRAFMRALLIVYGAYILVAVLVGPVFRALITNLIWNNTRLGEHRIECRISPVKLAWIGVSNLVLVVVTLGMFIPWAMVRLTRYQVECMRLLPASDLQEFVDSEPESVGAAGEEAASLFDFDIGL